MLKTNTEKLIRAAKNLSGLSWEEVARILKISPSNVQIAIRRNQMTRRYVEIAEALGYDVEIRLTIRE